MTLQSSGAISFNDINVELNNTATAALSLGGDECRWLTNQKTGPIAMSDLYGTRSMVVTDQAEGTYGTSHTFSSMDLGVNIADRRISIVAMFARKNTGITTGFQVTGITLNGVSVPNFTPAWYQGGSGTQTFAGVGIQSALIPSGTSGDLVFTTNWSTIPYVVLVSRKDPTTSTHDTGSANTGAATSLATSLDIPSDGQLFSFAVQTNKGETINWTNADKVGQADFTGVNYACSWALNNKMGSETGRSVTFDSTSSSIRVIGCLSSQE